MSLSVKWYICLSRYSNPLSHDPEALSWTKHVDQTSSSGLYDENEQYNEHIPYAVVVVCSGLTSLSTIFQSYHDGVWLRQGAQCSLLLCCDTEVSWPGFPVSLSAKRGAASTILKTLVCRRLGSNP